MESRISKSGDAAESRDPGSAEDASTPAGPELAGDAGVRLQEVVDTAERVAAEIRADVEAATALYAKERRREADLLAEERLRALGEISHSISARATQVQREALALVQDLDDAMRRLAALNGDDRPPSAPKAPMRGRSAEPVAYPGNGRLEKVPERVEREPVAYPGNRQLEKVPERARVRAVQMLATGTGTEEIERMLRTGFGIRNTAAVIEDALRVAPPPAPARSD